jgi:peroxiredoxin
MTAAMQNIPIYEALAQAFAAADVDMIFTLMAARSGARHSCHSTLC